MSITGLCRDLVNGCLNEALAVGRSLLDCNCLVYTKKHYSCASAECSHSVNVRSEILAGHLSVDVIYSGCRRLSTTSYMTRSLARLPATANQLSRVPLVCESRYKYIVARAILKWMTRRDFFRGIPKLPKRENTSLPAHSIMSFFIKQTNKYRWLSVTVASNEAIRVENLTGSVLA